MVLRPGFEPGSALWLKGQAVPYGSCELVNIPLEALDKFERFCKVDLSLAKKTVQRCRYEMGRLVKWLDGKLVSIDVLRDYLEPFHAEGRNNCLRSFRHYFRDYIKRPDLIMSFKFIKTPPKLVLNLPSKEDLQIAYETFETIRDKAMFLLYASSGVRRQELLDVTFDGVNFEDRMLVPGHQSRTKMSYITFYNEEAERAFTEYLETLPSRKEKPFPYTWNAYFKAERKVKKKTGVNVSPQILRQWFCNEMGSLRVPDRFIDAFCGRVPRSILARHYTDYSPKRLKQTYDKANLKVLA